MGSSGSCCCQKVTLLLASSEAPRNQREDGPVSCDVDVVSASGEAQADNKRATERKGAGRRIIGRSSNDDSAGEEHLTMYKKPQSKTADTKKLIKVAMKHDRVCALLEEGELDAIIETMEYYEFSPGTTIVEQGTNGTTFFVTEKGSAGVYVNDKTMNTLPPGTAFGGLALLYNCPRTATVRALDACCAWGANGHTFHKVLQDNAQKHYAENRKFLDSVRLFDGLTNKQKDRVGEAFFAEVFDAGSRVVTVGEAATAIYFVKKGELSICQGGQVKANGEFVGGKEVSRLGPGDCFGERALLKQEKLDSTVLASSRCECVCVSVTELREILGNDVGSVLERNFILLGLKKSPVMSQFSSSQQYQLAQLIKVSDYAAGAKIPDGLRFVIVVEGRLNGQSNAGSISLQRGQFYEDGAIVDTTGVRSSSKRTSVTSKASAASTPESESVDLRGIVVADGGARLGVLSQEAHAEALQQLGLTALGNAEEASDYTRKMVLAKKVHIFRHLSQEQVTKVVKAFVLQRYRKGAHVIKQGEVGSSFFVIARGEVTVRIDGKQIRTLAKNAYFGERALLFDEPRTATVEVSSSEAELWSVEKATFSQIVKGNMQQELMKRIRLQDTNLTIKDIRHIRVVGEGAAGVVRLVEHKKTHMRYALKRVKKHDGKVPEEVTRECALLAENDHPFIMALVKTFETSKSVYMLTELITGGELHGAIRMIPTVLSKTQAQFYTGSLVIVLEELSDRNIVYRDLKPENVMLDTQGYLKLIDFGIAKKLEEGKSRTFTMIGTPHYMAPEVMKGHGYGTEVDLWSLGVMLFEFVCGYLPFADELEDPTEVCTAVLKDPLSFPQRYKDQAGRALMQGLLHRQPKKRLGSGLHGFEDIRNSEYLQTNGSSTELFNKIMGRELDPPVVPKGETYCDPDDVGSTLSDAAELG
mmetsp:Transcript_76611/g.221445  ORF Transcript_76611/g.221445 Transcript_76611/m.221445 type:complete len:927 (-) Transcript_76611:142-2922(-)